MRARLNESFTRGAENQAFLVETVNGIDTLKAMAVEPQITRKWDNQLAGYVAGGFKTQNLSPVVHRQRSGLAGRQASHGRHPLAGARLVMEG